MDFIVSKVAMSVCALLVAGVLAELADPTNYVDAASELEGYLRELCSVAEAGVLAGCELDSTYMVPFFSDGSMVTIELERGAFFAQSRGAHAYVEPRMRVHVWRWDGHPLNSTSVEQLDTDTPGLAFRSGDGIEIQTRLVVFDNEPRLMVFASRG